MIYQQPFLRLDGVFMGRWTAVFILLLFLVACSGAETADSPPTPPPPQYLFTNVAAEVGLNFQHSAFQWEMSADPAAMMGGGLCWLDYNHDGWLDLFVVNSYAEAEAGKWENSGGLPRTALFRNVAGKFEDVSQATGADLPVRGNGCVAADFNLDGWSDLFITTARFSMLLWNQRGTFVEGAEAAGVDAYGWHTAAVVGDLNGDSWPDLFVAGYVDINNRIPGATMGFPNSHFGLRDQFFLNQGVDAAGFATFREVGEVVGLETADFEYGLGAVFTDADQDGDLDLYVANDTNPNRLYLNDPWPDGASADPEGIGFRLREAGAAAQVDDPNSGMGVAGGDYNQDGRFDLFVTNMGKQPNPVFSNQFNGSDLLFQNQTSTLNLPALVDEWTGWGTAWVDVDLDSDLDLLMVNGKIPVMNLQTDGEITDLLANLTAQGQPGLFEDITGVAGMEAVGPIIGRGSAVADFDNDGDPDIAINSIGGPLVLLQNNSDVGNWLHIKFDGFYPGTVVIAELPDGQLIYREIHSGSSYLSSEDPRCLLGLGTAEKLATLTIRWPNGTETIVKNVAANQYVVLRPPITADAN